jgi:hypothetical protein
MFTPLERRAGCSVHRRRSASPSFQRFASSQPSSSSPLAPHLRWKLSSHFFAAFLHSGHRNATAASGHHRAGSVLHRATISAPSCFNSGHPRARRELLNLFPHFPLAAGDHPRRNLITAIVIPRFKPARDSIASNLFFLGSTL